MSLQRDATGATGVYFSHTTGFGLSLCLPSVLAQTKQAPRVAQWYKISSTTKSNREEKGCYEKKQVGKGNVRCNLQEERFL